MMIFFVKKFNSNILHNLSYRFNKNSLEKGLKYSNYKNLFFFAFELKLNNIQ